MTMLTARQPPNQPMRDVQLRVFIDAKNGIPSGEVCQKADEKGLVVASNKQLSRVMVMGKGGGIETIRSALSCWSGTMTGYVEPGMKFREGGIKLRSIGADYKYAIIFTNERTGIRHIFPIPREYEDEKDAILVTEHPYFWIAKEGKDRIVQPARIDIVRNLPAELGWYLGDPKYDIPSGPSIESINQAARFLSRKAYFVGFCARFYGDLEVGANRQLIDLRCCPSAALGVVVTERSRIRFDEPRDQSPYRDAPGIIMADPESSVSGPGAHDSG